MGDGARILGVDDSLTIRKALELVLKPAGYTLELAASGAEAVDKAKGFKPEIVLLDFILPDMRGTEVCKRLASDPETAGIPIVLVSAKGAEIRQAYQDVGNVVNYITKPFTPDDVTTVVADVLARLRDGTLAVPAAAEAPVAPPPAPVAPPAPTAAPAPVAAPVVPPPVAAPVAPSAPVVTPSPAVAPPVAPTVPPSAPPAGLPIAARPAMAPAAPAGAPPSVAPAVSRPAAAESWEEGEEGAEEEATPVAPGAQLDEEARREALEMMFETLRASLEGVYVEEVDTPAGAAANQAKSYTDLVSQLARQLGETMGQAKSGMRFALSNGSLRSLDEALIDAYRRVCRLLFRAVVAGAVKQEAGVSRARVLIACRRDSQVFETLQAVTHQNAEWQAFLVAERFRQLPIMTRLYGPTHVIVEASRQGAVWDQLKIIRNLPEGKRLQIIGVRRADGEPAPVSPEMLAELGIDTVLDDGPEMLVGLRAKIAPQAAA